MVCGILFNVAIRSHSQKLLSSIANYGLVYKIPSHDKSRTTLCSTFLLTKNKLTTSYLPLFGTVDKYYFEAVEGNLPQ